MIEPTDRDVGRAVVYREDAGRKAEDGVLTSFNEKFAFVLYNGHTSAATQFADLEWRAPSPEGRATRTTTQVSRSTIRSVAAEFAELLAVEFAGYDLENLPKDERQRLRDFFYSGAACTLYAVLGHDPKLEAGRLTVDAAALEARHMELSAFLEDGG